MAFVHKKRSANVRRRMLFRLGAAVCALAPGALIVWWCIALVLAKKQPPAAMGCVVLAVAAVCANRGSAFMRSNPAPAGERND